MIIISTSYWYKYIPYCLLPVPYRRGWPQAPRWRRQRGSLPALFPSLFSHSFLFLSFSLFSFSSRFSALLLSLFLPFPSPLTRPFIFSFRSFSLLSLSLFLALFLFLLRGGLGRKIGLKFWGMTLQSLPYEGDVSRGLRRKMRAFRAHPPF